MTITTTDLKLRKSERMTDNDDGGGLMTANEVIDGQVGNVFPKISRTDRAAGVVNLRKVFALVETGNSDTLYGGHLIITDPPDDPAVHMLMFETGSFSDERTAAQNFVESYVIKGPVSTYRLYDTQQTGQRAMVWWTTPSEVSPEVGEVYCLSVEASGYPTHEQFVRLTSIEYVDRQFTYDNGQIKTWRLYTVGINQPLDQQYPGEDPQTTPNPTVASIKTKVRRTQVADVAIYYGIARLAESIVPNDKVIQLGSIYGQVVPATTTETPVIDEPPSGVRSVQIAAGPPITQTIAAGSSSASTKALYLGGSIFPGSLTVVSATEGLTYTDVAGVLYNASSAAKCNGSPVDYAAAAIVLNANASGGNYTITWTPAATVSQSPHSTLYEIEQETQRYNYTFSLSPLPSPKSIRISYRALNKWYVLEDDGAGSVTPLIDNTGSGLIDYQTGSLIATLGALPDVGSAILINWGETEIYEQLVGDVTVELPVFTVYSPDDPDNPGQRLAIDPESLSISWTNGTAKASTDNGAGTVTGDASGRVDYANGIVQFRPTSLPVSGTIYTVTLTCGAAHADDAVGTMTGATLSDTLSPGPLREGSIYIRVPLESADLPAGYYYPDSSGVAYSYVPSEDIPPLEVWDDGAGNLKTEAGVSKGTINYSTGDFSVNTAGTVTVKLATSSGLGGATSYSNTTLVTQGGGAYDYRFAEAATDFNAEAVELLQGAIELSMLKSSPVYRDAVPGGIRFVFNGATYFDRGTGVLYRNIDPLTGSAIVSGSITYGGGVCEIAEYASGTYSLSIKAMAVTQGLLTGSYCAFRTAGAPLAVGSLFMSATALDGTHITATADNTGALVASEMVGTVDVQTGVVEVNFGHYETVGADEVWVPKAVDLSSISYNAVITVYLPLDAEFLGLDPTRLPLDGRVPIFRTGQLAVVHHTDTETLPAPLAAGQVVTLSRAPITICRFYDENGLAIPDTLYSVDLEAGEVTWADPLDLSAYQQPLVAETRIEDMALVTDVQINGQITLQRGVAFNYPASEAYVSSVLRTGNLQSRVEYLFTQKTWTNVWSDERIGDDSVAKYNDVIYPISINNRTAITERWAIIFTTATAFNVVGEFSGVIATGNTSTDCAPINPATITDAVPGGEPYFVIDADGWGSGWVANNVLRFNTVGAAYPIWMSRSIESSVATVINDGGRVEFRGDAD